MAEIQRILLLEDSAVDAAVVANIIREINEESKLSPCELRHVTTLMDAVHAIEEFVPDLVMVDLTVPTGTGFVTEGAQTLESIRQCGYHGRMAVVSSDCDPEIESRCLVRGDAYVWKSGFSFRDHVRDVIMSTRGHWPPPDNQIAGRLDVILAAIRRLESRFDVLEANVDGLSVDMTKMQETYAKCQVFCGDAKRVVEKSKKVGWAALGLIGTGVATGIGLVIRSIWQTFVPAP